MDYIKGEKKVNENAGEKDVKIEQLILKCNKQLDYIHNLENQLKEKDKRIEEYKTIIQNNDTNFVSNVSNENVINDSIYQDLCNAFFKTLEYIIRNNGNIEGKRIGKVSISNMIVKATYFKALIPNYTTVLSADKIIKLWCDLGMLRFNETKNMPYFTHNVDGKSIRVIRICKDWVSLVKESMIQ